MTLGADVIVVGAGTSGCVLAERLSQNPSRRVLLLESGAVPRSIAEFPPDLLDAGTVRGAVPHQGINWTFPALLTPDRPYATVRGRILGGSSTINGGYFIRPRTADFSSWAEAGGPPWAYERALPTLIGIEADADFGRTPIHGDRGPVPVRRSTLEGPASAAFGAAAERLGFVTEPDKNDQAAPGFGPVPANVSDGVRQNTGVAYLLPAIGRPNLTAVGGATATHLLFAGARVTGVEYLRDGRLDRAYADHVVLCAGAFTSAHLLMLSGIGPAGELRRAGIPVVAHSPAVGTRFSDHPQLVIEWTPRRQRPAAPGEWMGGALHTDDLELLGTVKPMSALLEPAHGGDLAPLALMASVQAPRNTGRLRLTSADPLDPPLIDYGYLRDGDDRRRMREAARLCLDLLSTPDWQSAHDGLIGITPEDAADARTLDSWIAAHLGTALHTCGTVPFGGTGAAADGEGRVRGVEGLTVADTSILPTAPRRGPALAAVLVGEVIAAHLCASDAVPPRAVVR